MGRILKLLTAAALLLSAAHALRQLRALSELKRSLGSASDPAQALAALSQSDASGVVGQLAAAQLASLSRLAGPESDSAPVPKEPNPEPPPGDGRQRLFTAGKARGGSGVMVEHATGRRTVIEGDAAPKLALPSLPTAPAKIFSDDLKSRTRRAYALLLGTVAAAVALVLRARRAAGR